MDSDKASSATPDSLDNECVNPQSQEERQKERIEESVAPKKEDEINSAIQEKVLNYHAGNNTQIETVNGGNNWFGSINLDLGDFLSDLWKELSAKDKQNTDKPITSSKQSLKKYRLEDVDECCTLFSEMDGSRCLLYACMLAFYGIVRISDAIWLIDALDERLPEAKIGEDAKTPYQVEIFSTLDSFLFPIHAKRTPIKVPDKQLGSYWEEFVHLPQQGIVDAAMRNVWMMLPHLHNCFMDWLLHSLVNGSISIHAQTQIVISKVIQLDFHYGYEHIIKPLSKNAEMLYPLSNILGFLLTYEQTADAANRIVQNWMKIQHPWLWKIGVLLYVWAYKGEYRGDIQQLIIRLLSQTNLGDKAFDDMLRFIGGQLPGNQGLRDFLATTLQLLFNDGNFDKNLIFYIYISLFSEALSRLWRKKKMLPFLVTDSETQYDILEPLHQYILRHNDLWKPWCFFVHKYIQFFDDAFIENNPCDTIILKKIVYFFKKLTYKQPWAQQRVLAVFSKNEMKESHTACCIMQSINIKNSKEDMVR